MDYVDILRVGDEFVCEDVFNVCVLLNVMFMQIWIDEMVFIVEEVDVIMIDGQ